MSKYSPLKHHLRTARQQSVRLTFSDIERIIGSKLPPSAHNHREWWGNEREGSHVQARAWMDAGFEVSDVNPVAEAVTFERSR